MGILGSKTAGKEGGLLRRCRRHVERLERFQTRRRRRCRRCREGKLDRNWECAILLHTRTGVQLPRAKSI